MKKSLQLSLLLALFIACGQKRSITKSDVVQLMDTWKEAYYKKDTVLLGEVLHRDYVYSGNTDGFTSTRKQSMLNLANSDFRILQIDLNDLDMRFYNHIAIIRGGEMLTLQLNSGDTIRLKLRFTDIYIKENGRTQALSTHSSPIE